MGLGLRLLNTQKFDVHREDTTTGRYQNGIRVVGALIEYKDVIGHVQPLSGKQLEKLPENVREKQTYQFFTQVPGFEFQLGDLITYKGIQYEALKQQDWDGYQMNAEHSFAIGVLVDDKSKVVTNV